MMQHNAVIKCYMRNVENIDPYATISGMRSDPKDMFVGCQPESLHLHHLQQLIRSSYFVTTKTDGDRYVKTF